jgi:hypothetical protein
MPTAGLLANQIPVSRILALAMVTDKLKLLRALEWTFDDDAVRRSVRAVRTIVRDLLEHDIRRSKGAQQLAGQRSLSCDSICHLPDGPLKQIPNQPAISELIISTPVEPGEAAQ